MMVYYTLVLIFYFIFIFFSAIFIGKNCNVFIELTAEVWECTNIGEEISQTEQEIRASYIV